MKTLMACICILLAVAVVMTELGVETKTLNTLLGSLGSFLAGFFLVALLMARKTK